MLMIGMAKLCLLLSGMDSFLTVVLSRVALDRVVFCLLLYLIFMLIQTLKDSDFGCHLGRRYVGCIAYADDIILLSASISGLERMLNICYNKGAAFDIIFNAEKSCLCKIGKVTKKRIDELFIDIR